MNEEILLGQIYRYLYIISEKLWNRVSYWKVGADVELADGRTLQEAIDAIETSLENTVSIAEEAIKIADAEIALWG